MSKKLKYVIIGVAVVVVLAVSAMMIVPKLVDANLFRSQIISAVNNATGRELTINGELKWKIFPGFKVEADQVALSNPAGFSEKNMASIDQLKLSVEILPLLLSKKIVLNQLELSGTTIHLITLPNGHTNWQDLVSESDNKTDKASTNKTSSSEANAANDNINFNIDNLLLDNSTLIWDDQQQHNQVKLSELTISSTSFSLDNTFPLSIKTKIQHPPAAQVINLDVTTDVNLDLKKHIYTLSALTAGGSIQENPTAQIQTINLTLDELKIDPVTKAVTLKKMLFDGFGTHAKGELKAERSGAHPVIQGKFNLDQLLLGKLKITNINLPIKAQNGVYTLDPVTSQLYGGNLSGNVKLNLVDSTPKWQVNYQMADLQTQSLFSEVFGYKRFTGTAQSNGQLTTAGTDSDSILRSLTGALQFKLMNGSLEGIDLSYWWQVGNKLLSTDPTLVELTDHKRTEIANMSGDITFKNGVGTTNNFQLSNSVLFVKGSGQIDMVRQYVNMTLYVSQNKNGQPTGTAIPLLMSGSFDNITVKPDEKTIAAMATKILSSKVGQAATQAITKTIPGEIAQPLNSAVNKLFGQ